MAQQNTQRPQGGQQGKPNPRPQGPRPQQQGGQNRREEKLNKLFSTNLEKDPDGGIWHTGNQEIEAKMIQMFLDNGVNLEDHNAMFQCRWNDRFKWKDDRKMINIGKKISENKNRKNIEYPIEFAVFVNVGRRPKKNRSNFVQLNELRKAMDEKDAGELGTLVDAKLNAIIASFRFNNDVDWCPAKEDPKKYIACVMDYPMVIDYLMDIDPSDHYQVDIMRQGFKLKKDSRNNNTGEFECDIFKKSIPHNFNNISKDPIRFRIYRN